MRDTAISTEHLTKIYKIARSQNSRNRITDAIGDRLRDPFRRESYSVFSAISDLNIDVPWGEAVGIIGRNGAGKSTLLKLLTRVAAPTTGVIDLGGRVGSLLEVGTGFHPELTGRENIFLNGALLGMTRAETKRRFDEIVDFSGVEKFLETPVKRYSSGMYVRLAFSVAAHLETEILAIDEVLAVGDAEFQAKSIEKMRQAAQAGRTVLYVSHQPQTVTSLCSTAIVLESGRLTFSGDVDGALARYRDSFESFQRSQEEPDMRPGSGQLRFKSVSVTERVQDPTDDTVIEFITNANEALVGKCFVSCHINDSSGNVVVQCDSRLTGAWFDPSRVQHGAIRIKSLWFKPGRYTVDLFLCQSGVLDRWEGADSFTVLPSAPYPEFSSDESMALGAVFADFEYEVA